MDSTKALIWFLRLLGGVTLLAFVAVFLPTSWMAEVHSRLGMGPFPAAPLTDYLARSLSLFYALIGALMLVLATDPERYRPLIVYAGWGSIAAGAIMLWIDLQAGLPFWWTWHEGPAAALCGFLILWWVRAIPQR